MKLKQATRDDINGVLDLQKKYHIDTIAEEDKKDGFVTTAFTEKQLTDLVEQEWGLFVAKNDSTLVAYLMAASWKYWSAWPLFVHLMKSLSEIEYAGIELSTDNSYQYGPVCIDKSVRGSGLLESLFAYAKKEMAHSYPVLVTFINKNNPRSFRAHTAKLNLDVVREFEFNGNFYWELAGLTRPA